MKLAAHLALGLSLTLLAVPVAFIGTMLLAPFWSWFEATTGVEAMGHSGPAGWCFGAVFSVLLLLDVAFVIQRWRAR